MSLRIIFFAQDLAADFPDPCSVMSFAPLPARLCSLPGADLQPAPGCLHPPMLPDLQAAELRSL